MAIEFRCTTCNKLLRTKDDTAGKQARCPECATILQVPASSTALPETPPNAPPRNPPQQSRPAAPPQTFAPPPRDPFAAPPPQPAYAPSDNPFAAPQFAGQSARLPDQYDRGERTGPPWERDGASPGSFWETAKLVWSGPTRLFSEMRLEGGVGSPMGFALVGNMIGAVGSMLFSGAIQSIAIFGQGRGDVGPKLAVMAMGLGFTLVFMVVGVCVGLFISAAILHLMLMLVGGAKAGYETTYRVLCYSGGATALANVVPCVGPLAAIVMNVVTMIIGLAQAHEISIGKAALAVFLPLIVCGGLAVLAFVMVFAAALRQ